MKKITAFLGFVGVVSMISACSDSGTGVVEGEETAIISSSSVAKASSSSVSGSSETKVSSSSGVDKHDTVVVSTQIDIPVSTDHSSPYMSSGVICWPGDDCAQVSSSSSTASSSSFSLEVTMSSEAPVYPLVTETQMIDQRDGKTYSLQTVAGVHWMAQNLNYETKANSFCSVEGGDDLCAKYGRFYTYAAAQMACPTGWRLPTQAEVETLDASVEHEWWSVGGRFKIADGKATDYGLEDEQGYIWILIEGDYSSFRIKNYSGDSPHEFQTGSVADRAYNVRCVEDK